MIVIDYYLFTSCYFNNFDAAYTNCLFLLIHLLLNISGCLPISHVTSFHSKTDNKLLSLISLCLINMNLMMMYY